MVERAGRTHLASRRHVPLAETAGDVAVLLQHPGQRRAATGTGAGVAGVRRGELRDPAHAHAVVVPARQQRGAGGRADRRHVKLVVGDPHLLDSAQVWGLDRAAERVGPAEACVIDQDDEDVRGVLRWLDVSDDRPVACRLGHGPSDRSAERTVRYRQHRAVRVELARGGRQRLLQTFQAASLDRCHRFRRRPSERAFGGEPVLRVDRRQHRGHPRLEVGRQPLCDPAGDLVAGESTDEAARGRADGHRAEQWRGSQPDEDADTSAPPHALAAGVVSGLAHLHLACLVAFDEDRPFAANLLRPDQFDELVELGSSGFARRVGDDQDLQLVRHDAHSFFVGLVVARRPDSDRSAEAGPSQRRRGHAGTTPAAANGPRSYLPSRPLSSPIAGDRNTGRSASKPGISAGTLTIRCRGRASRARWRRRARGSTRSPVSRA